MTYVVYYEFPEESEYYREFGDNETFYDEGYAYDFVDDLKEDGASLITITRKDYWGGRLCDEEEIYRYGEEQ